MFLSLFELCAETREKQLKYNHELRGIENAYIRILIMLCMRITIQEPGNVSGWGKRYEIIQYLSLQTLCEALIDFTFPALKGFVFPDRYTEQYYADSFSNFYFSRLPESFS